jgi:hypothetical protein
MGAMKSKNGGEATVSPNHFIFCGLKNLVAAAPTQTLVTSDTPTWGLGFRPQVPKSQRFPGVYTHSKCQGFKNMEGVNLKSVDVEGSSTFESPEPFQGESVSEGHWTLGSSPLGMKRYDLWLCRSTSARLVRRTQTPPAAPGARQLKRTLNNRVTFRVSTSTAQAWHPL